MEILFEWIMDMGVGYSVSQHQVLRPIPEPGMLLRGPWANYLL